MKVALAQINTVVGDVWGNVDKAAGALERAVEGGADLVAFPELAVTGYPPWRSSPGRSPKVSWRRWGSWTSMGIFTTLVP